MYNNNNYHPDPYAGQYPTPPPLQSPPPTEQYTPPITTHFSTPIQHQEYHIPPPPQQQQDIYYPQEPYIPPSAPAPALSDSYYPQQYSNNHHNNYQYEQDGNSLDAYLRQEREEYLKNESKPQDTIPLNQDPEKAPMLENASSSSSSHQKKPKPEYQPYVVKPTLAPPNEAEAYQYQPYDQRRNKSCSCCCYNPAITCCSFFMLLVSIGFCAAGIALIIASKVISSKCDSSCNNISDSVANACNTVCNTVLQNGLFYGGIVVAGLAGIAIIWKLVMWTCAGYSQRH